MVVTGTFKQVMIRLNVLQLRRLRKLDSYFLSNPRLTPRGSINTSERLRIALAAGLDALEEAAKRTDPI